MSTKTTFKRVALVAVAALGLGVLSSVAPATAASPQTPTAVSFGSAANLRAGVAGSVTVTFALPSGTAIGDSVTVLARVTSAPSTSFATAKAAVPGTAAISAIAASASSFWWSAASSGSGSYTTVPTNSYNSAGINVDGTSDWTAASSYTLTTGDSVT